MNQLPESQTKALLSQLLSQVPFLALKSFSRGVRASSPTQERADAVARIESGGRTWTVVIEEKRLGQPQEVRFAIHQLKSYLSQLPNPRTAYGIVVAPFISEQSARICDAAGIGHLDMAGNAHLSFDKVFIRMRSAENPFRERRAVRSLFTPKAERVLRILLTPPLRAWKVEELAEAAQVSVGQVSNVRKRLLAEEWASISEQGMRLIKPEALARSWQKSYRVRALSREASYTLLHGEAMEGAIRMALADAGNGEHAVLASYSAARWIAPYARQFTQFFYADKKGALSLQRHLKLQPVARGENVVLMEPKEDDIFSGRIEAAPGIWCTGIVQTWLDLGVAGERGEEAAEHLLREKLLPAWSTESA